MRVNRVMVVVAASVVLMGAVGAYAYAASGQDTPAADDPSTKATTRTSDAPSSEPEPEPSPSKTPTADHECGETGEYQQEVEEILDRLGGYGEVFIDGEQSVEDCSAIEAFQKRYGIEPGGVYGYAGDITVDVARRIDETDFDSCETTKGTVVCVDLTHQTMWVQEDGEVVHGPTIVRTGMAGYNTDVGVHPIGWKNESEWSKPYKVWLPYWQQFSGGQGLHETTTYIHDMGNGSHGCVNLLHDDAVAVWELTEVGGTVEIFGQRPGT